MNQLSMLEQLQGVAVNELSSDPYFDGSISANGTAVPVITEAKGEITTQVETALGSVGICALVMTPLFQFIDNLVQDLSGYALLTITVFENVSLNQQPTGTQINAIVLAQRILELLHWFPHKLPTNKAETVPAFIGITRPFELTNPGPPLQYTVNFQAYVLLQ